MYSSFVEEREGRSESSSVLLQQTHPYGIALQETVGEPKARMRSFIVVIARCEVLTPVRSNSPMKPYQPYERRTGRIGLLYDSVNCNEKKYISKNVKNAFIYVANRVPTG